jgi:hypothetical protein
MTTINPKVTKEAARYNVLRNEEPRLPALGFAFTIEGANRFEGKKCIIVGANPAGNKIICKSGNETIKVVYGYILNKYGNFGEKK